MGSELFGLKEGGNTLSSKLDRYYGVEYGQLHYLQIEIEKTMALKRAKGDFDQNMTLSEKAKRDGIKWWINHAKISKKKISHGTATLTLPLMHQMRAGGATTGQRNTGGRWSLKNSLCALMENNFWLSIVAFNHFLMITDTAILTFSQITQLQWLIYIIWVAPIPPSVMRFPGKFGCGVKKGTCGSQ